MIVESLSGGWGRPHAYMYMYNNTTSMDMTLAGFHFLPFHCCHYMDLFKLSCSVSSIVAEHTSIEYPIVIPYFMSKQSVVCVQAEKSV